MIVAASEAERALTDTNSLLTADMIRQTPDREAVICNARILMDSCQSEQDVVEGQLKDIDTQWSSIQNGMT